MEHAEPPNIQKLHKEFENTLRDNLKGASIASLCCNAGISPIPRSASSASSVWTNKVRRFPKPSRRRADWRPVRARGFRGSGARIRQQQRIGRQAAARAAGAAPRRAGLHPVAGRNSDEGTPAAPVLKGKVAINVRGMEYLQTNPGEDEDTAWRRLRPSFRSRVATSTTCS